MSRELDLLAKEFSKTPATVIRAEVNLYQSSIQSATANFLREVDRESKKNKESHLTLVCILKEK